MKIVKIIVDKT